MTSTPFGAEAFAVASVDVRVSPRVPLCRRCGIHFTVFDLDHCESCEEQNIANRVSINRALAAVTAAVVSCANGGGKPCRTCGVVKDYADFGKHSTARDGHRHDCRDCVLNLPAPKPAKSWKLPPSQVVAHRVAVASWKQRNPEAHRAHSAVSRALKSGTIVKANVCEMPGCGSRGVLEAHHDDYGKPLEIRWVCRPCHRRGHERHALHAVNRRSAPLDGRPRRGQRAPARHGVKKPTREVHDGPAIRSGSTASG